MKTTTRLSIALMTTLFPILAFADNIEVLGGTTLRDGSTEVVEAGYRIPVSHFLSGTALEENVTYVGSSSFNGPQPSKVIGSSNVIQGWKFLFVGLGVSVSKPDRYNGSYINFRDTIGVNLPHHFSVRFSHYSNAGLFRGPNTGRDMLLVGYTF